MALYIFYLSGGNSYVRYLYRSGGRWYSNYNWLGNDWNDNNFNDSNPALRFATSFISPPYLGEFCFSSWPLQPPNIFPISSIFSDKTIYFLLSIDLVSQSIIKNILSVSTFLIDRQT